MSIIDIELNKIQGDIISLVCLYLTAEEILNLSLVCKSLNHTIHADSISNIVWMKCYRNTWPEEPSITSKVEWKSRFRNRMALRKDWLKWNYKRTRSMAVDGIGCSKALACDGTSCIATGWLSNGFLVEGQLFEDAPPIKYQTTMGICDVAFSSELVMGGTYTGNVVVYKRGEGEKALHVIPHSPSGHPSTYEIRSVQFDKEKIVGASEDWTVKIWDTSTMTLLNMIHQEGKLWVARYNNDAHTMCTGGYSNYMALYDTRNYQKVASMKSGSSEGIFSLQYDDHKVVAGTMNGCVQIWDLRMLKLANQIQNITAHETNYVEWLQYDSEKLVVPGKMFDFREPYSPVLTADVKDTSYFIDFHYETNFLVGLHINIPLVVLYEF